MIALPVWGLKKASDPIQRNQCKLWLAVAAPLSLLIITIMILLHYEIHWFNATVTAPLLFAALMGAMGYSVHNQRPIEIDYFFPWSKTHWRKKELYAGLEQLSQEISQTTSFQVLVNRLADIFQCPAVIVTRNALIAATTNSDRLLQFPKEELEGIRYLIVGREVVHTSKLASDMSRLGVAIIAPFYPNNQDAAT